MWSFSGGLEINQWTFLSTLVILILMYYVPWKYDAQTVLEVIKKIVAIVLHD